jgi:ribosomal-protein-alanine N-acetyltransferase
VIETKRLKLIPLTLSQLELCLEDPDLLAAELKLKFAGELINKPVATAITLKIEKMGEVDVDQHLYCTYWLMVIVNENLGAGFIGYKGAPNDVGEIEIGYGISPDCRSKGYTTEAAISMIDWAFNQDEVCAITALYIVNTNAPSIRILEKLGFKKFGEGPGTHHRKLRREKWGLDLE